MKKPVVAKAVQGTATAEVTSDASETAAKPAQSADQLLKADHRKVEQLFKKYEGLTQSSEKAECAREICKELIIHAQLEEEIFYPACRQKGVKSDMLDEAQVEHDGAKVMIRELLSGDPGADYYDAKVTVLSEYIKHHVGEEEKGSEGIFALAKAAGVDMSALGSELQARKAELMQEVGDGAPAAPEFRALQVQDRANQSKQENTMPRYDSESRGYASRGGRSSGGGRERDDYGRFMSDDDDRGSRSQSSRGRERDEYGRFTSDDDDDRGSRGRSSRSRYDDEDDDRGSYGSRSSSRGRYEDDDDDRGSSRGRSSSSGRYEDDDDDRGSRGSRSGGGRSRDDDDNGRDQGRGWFGDSEGHAEAARRGSSSRSGSGRSRSDDDDDYRGSFSRSSRSRYDDDDDDRGSRSSSRGRSRDDDDDDRGQGGWFGDSEGHSEAARRGWESRSSSGRSRSSDDDDRRGSRSGSSRNGGSGSRSGGSSSRGGGSSSSSRGGEGHGGWFGDSRGHAEAARRGWRNRD